MRPAPFGLLLCILATFPCARADGAQAILTQENPRCTQFASMKADYPGDPESLRAYLLTVPVACAFERESIQADIARLQTSGGESAPARGREAAGSSAAPLAPRGALATPSFTVPVHEVRIALVIGNAAYRKPSLQLTNPVHDAALIAGDLRRLGFEVEYVENADRSAMEGAFRRFDDRLRSAGRDAVSFVYYSGHGAEYEGVNYLVPVDADVDSLDQLRFSAPPVQLLFDSMAEAGNSINIVVLDACRDMGLRVGSRSLSRGGLAPIDQVPNVLVAFSTAPGQTASDGDRADSLFTAELSDSLERHAAEPVEILFSKLSSTVLRETAGAQRPRYSYGLGVSNWSLAQSR